MHKWNPCYPENGKVKSKVDGDPTHGNGVEGNAPFLPERLQLKSGTAGKSTLERKGPELLISSLFVGGEMVVREFLFLPVPGRGSE